MRVHFTNLGCKLNQAEIERLARDFTAAGHEVVGSLAEADLHVVNSCTVTHVAARASRKAAGRGHREGRVLRTVLTGCHASEDAARLRQLAGVDLVVPNAREGPPPRPRPRSLPGNCSLAAGATRARVAGAVRPPALRQSLR